MSEVVDAEYLAEQLILKLARPLDGVSDHEHIRVLIEQTGARDHSLFDQVTGLRVVRW